MESDVLWKAAMKLRLPTGLGKRRQEAAAVSHSSHSLRQRQIGFREEREPTGHQESETGATTFVPSGGTRLLSATRHPVADSCPQWP